MKVKEILSSAQRKPLWELKEKLAKQEKQLLDTAESNHNESRISSLGKLAIK